MSLKINKTNPKLVFLLLLGFLFLAYRYPHSIQKGPYSIHMWRQADCLSLAMNYYQQGMRFFQPSIHWVGANGSDRVVSEFPILYYTVAALWKVFGHSHFIYRILSLLIVYLGLYYLFRFFSEYLGDNFWAIYIPVLLFTSPALIYYSNNFLMDAPAFGLVLIAFYHFWKYHVSGKRKRLYYSMGLFLLAGLIKISALLLLVAIIMVQILPLLRFLRHRFDVKSRTDFIQWPLYALVIVINVIWIFWARNYNIKNIQGIFRQGISPIWENGLYSSLEIGTGFYNDMLPQFFNITALFFILFSGIWLITKFSRTDIWISTLMAFTFGGAILFMVLFYPPILNHDYYLINLLIFIPLIMAVLLDFLKRHHTTFYKSRALRGIAVSVLLFLIYNAMVEQRIKYDTDDTFIKHTIIRSNNYKNHWKYLQEVHEATLDALEETTPYLRELGIDRNDRVISMPDPTPNVSLYLMDQKGYTDFGYGILPDEERMDYYIDLGARYLIINDPRLLEWDYLKPYMGVKIGELRNVTIFSLTNLQQETNTSPE